MKLKLDENLGNRCLDLLSAAGHDVATVLGEKLVAASDKELIEVCKREGRALVTLDRDFSNPLLYRPSDYAGIAVLRLPKKPSHDDLLACARTLIAAMRREKLAGFLWSVERARVRIYQQPDDADAS